jgi:hypothetical protein
MIDGKNNKTAKFVFLWTWKRLHDKQTKIINDDQTKKAQNLHYRSDYIIAFDKGRTAGATGQQGMLTTP